jgi:hypothetical protein
MPYIIKNISSTNKRFKEAVPLTIEFKDDYGATIKHVINPDDSIILYFIPPTAKILHINNMISIDHISSNDVKLFSIKKEAPVDLIVEDAIVVNDGVNDGIDIIIDDNGISENNDSEDVAKNKRKKT